MAQTIKGSQNPHSYVIYVSKGGAPLPHAEMKIKATPWGGGGCMCVSACASMWRCVHLLAQTRRSQRLQLANNHATAP